MFSFIARRAAVRLPLLAGSRLPTRTLFTTSRLLIASTDNVSPATAKSTSKATTEPTTKAKKPRKVSEKKPAPKKKKVVRKKPVLPKRMYSLLTRCGPVTHRFVSSLGVQVTKDMLPPKRPSSAYMMFYTSLLSHRPRIADKSDIAASGISGGKAWHALSEEEKQA
ncbi:hypothetical protein OF83DRAFT_1137015 [Amylostereum chailletii]|nr:hypothetical protein OF83DRAFT_1137015 [Amylostereum chailletii]